MPRIDIAFLLTATACLIVAVCLGIYMGISKDFQLAPVHGHLNLIGWASLALFAVIYRLYPELAGSRLARVHFWLAAPSALGFPVGIYFAVLHEAPGLAIAASLLWLAGAVVFFVAIARMALSSAPASTLDGAAAGRA